GFAAARGPGAAALLRPVERAVLRPVERAVLRALVRPLLRAGAAAAVERARERRGVAARRDLQGRRRRHLRGQAVPLPPGPHDDPQLGAGLHSRAVAGAVSRRSLRRAVLPAVLVLPLLLTACGGSHEKHASTEPASA